MSVNVGAIDLGLDVNRQSFNKQLNGIAGGAEKSVKSAFSGMGKTIGLVLGGAAVVSFTKSCLELGSNLNEVQNVVDVTFKQMNGSVNEFAKNAMTQFGLSETVAKKYMGTLGAMSNSMGFSEQQSYKMAKAITGLSGDVASFYNMSSDEAYTKLKSIWTGETETLKEIGVVMTQTALDQYALNNGFGKTTAKMTEQEKVMLRYQYVMSSLSAAQGDFARTSDSWANQIRVLGLRFDSLKASLGQGLINLFTPIVKVINGILLKLQSLADGFKTFTELITGKKASQQTSNAIATIGAGAADAATNISGMGDAAASAAKKAQKSLMGFDQVNVLADNSSSSTGGSGNTGASSGGGTPGTSSGVSSNDSMTSSMSKLQEAIQPTLDAFDRFKTAMEKPINFAKNGIKDFYKDFLKPLGKWAVSKGVPDFLDTLSETANKINWKNLNKSLDDLWKALEPFAETVGDGFNWLAKKVLSPLIVFGANFVLPEGLDMVASYFEHMNKNLNEMKGAVKPVEGLFQSLEDFTEWYNKLPDNQKLSGMWDGLLDKETEFIKGFKKDIKDLKNGDFASYWDGVSERAEKLGKTLKDIFLGIDTSPIEKDVDKVKKSLSEGFQDKVVKVKAEIGTKWSDLKSDWNTLVGNVKDKTAEFKADITQKWSDLSAKWDGLTKNIKDEWADFKAQIPQVWGDLSSKWNGLTKNVQDKWAYFRGQVATKWSDLSGTWNTLIENFKDKTVDFKVKLSTTVGSVRNFVNEIIDSVNSNLIAKLDFGFKNPFTGSMWTWKAPRIPMLAEGGYVKPNTPQLAVIGDNKHEGEVVAPESKLTQMALEAARLAGGSGGLSEAALYRVMSRVFQEYMHIYIGEEDLARHVNRGNQMIDLRNSPVKGGGY